MSFLSDRRTVISLFFAAMLSASAVTIKAAEMVYDYFTPQMFGAKGNGMADDTEALRKALYESSHSGKVLYITAGSQYKVSGTLNYYNGRYQDLKLNLLGCIPIGQGS